MEAHASEGAVSGDGEESDESEQEGGSKPARVTVELGVVWDLRCPRILAQMVRRE